MTMALMFLIPSTEVITANGRLHYRVQAERVARLRLRGAMTWLNAVDQGYISPMQYARITAWLTFRDRRRRDPNNWSPTTKALIDGMVSGSNRHIHTGPFIGLLPDDDAGHLIGPDHRLTQPLRTLAEGSIRIVMTVQPLDAAPAAIHPHELEKTA